MLTWQERKAAILNDANAYERDDSIVMRCKGKGEMSFPVDMSSETGYEKSAGKMAEYYIRNYEDKFPDMIFDVESLSLALSKISRTLRQEEAENRQAERLRRS